MPRIPKIIYVLLAALVMAAVGFTVVKHSTFRITEISPDLSSVATATPYIDIHFNRPIKKDGIKLSSRPDILESHQVINSTTLRITLTGLTDKEEYLLVLEKVESEKNERITNKQFTFKAKFTSFSDLTQKQQEQALKNQDRPAAPKDKIFDILPYYHASYELQVEITPGVSRPDILFVYLPAPGEGEVQKDAYLEDAKQYLVGKGISLDEYRLVDSDEGSDHVH